MLRWQAGLARCVNWTDCSSVRTMAARALVGKTAGRWRSHTMTPIPGFANDLRLSQTVGLVGRPTSWVWVGTNQSNWSWGYSLEMLGRRITTPDRRIGDMCKVLRVDTVNLQGVRWAKPQVWQGSKYIVPYVVWLMRLLVNAVGYPQKVSDFLSSIRCKWIFLVPWDFFGQIRRWADVVDIWNEIKFILQVGHNTNSNI